MIVEICANSFESARIAQNAGADRIELCEDLSVGGLTPSRELIKKVISELIIPAHVLIRPRSGDFCYSEIDLEKMLEDIAYCKQLGCAGVVCGALTRDNNIDAPTTEQLINASKGMEYTFHRAFDLCNDPIEALQLLKGLGVTRLLSSGQQPKAVEGIPLLKSLTNASEEGIQIQPGGGINSENALLFKDAGFEMIHFSATKKITVPGSSTDLFHSAIMGDSDPEEIERIMKLLGRD